MRLPLVKFFLYALGAVILIFIGISVNMQISNWKNSKLNLKQELEQIYSIKGIMENQAEVIKNQSLDIATTLNSLNVLIAQMDSNVPYNDSLDFHFQNTTSWKPLNVDETAIEGVLSDDVVREELRKDILAYTTKAKAIKDMEERVLSPFYGSTVTPLMLDHFVISVQDKTATPSNYQQLKSEQRFINMLNMSKEKNQIYLKMCEELGEMNADVRKAIEEVLDYY